MAGDSIADAEALKKADVGMCMGTGCDVAKDNSDLVILDNDFYSIQRAIRWGRSIFENVRKFMVFQMTVNISLLTVTFLGGATLGHLPLNVIQMLWVNLIMDILAAIALGTEPYDKYEDTGKANKSNRVSRREKIMTQEMWRQILVQSAFQITVITIYMYFGNLIFFDGFNLVSTPLWDNKGNATNRLKLDTLIFHTFVTMTLVNQINARVINPNDLNVFTMKLFNNKWFWIVFGFELFVQQGFLFLGAGTLTKKIVGTYYLEPVYQIICWTVAFLGIAVGIGAKKIPLQHFEFTKNIDLEAAEASDFITQAMEDGDKYFQRRYTQITQDEDETEADGETPADDGYDTI